MSCDLTDNAIVEAYQQIMNSKTNDWLLLGYKGTRDVITLYAKGGNGLNGLKEKLTDEVLYAYLCFKGKGIVVTYIGPSVNGVQRARSLVHGRKVRSIFKDHKADLNCSSIEELNEQAIFSALGSSEERLNLDTILPQKAVVQDLPAVRATPTEDKPLKPTRFHSFHDAKDAASITSVNSNAPNATSPHGSPHAERRPIEEEEKRVQEYAANKRRQSFLAQKEAERMKEQSTQLGKLTLKRKQDSRLTVEKLKNEMQSNKGFLAYGFLSLQRMQSVVWHYYFYVLENNNMQLYRDETRRKLIIKIDFIGAHFAEDEEILLPNSFRLESQGDAWNIRADTPESKDMLQAAILLVAEK